MADKVALFDSCKFQCEVTIVSAKGQPLPSNTEFHEGLLRALQQWYNTPTTPFYISEVSVTGAIGPWPPT